MPDTGPLTIEPLGGENGPLGAWQPCEGEEVHDFIQHAVPTASRADCLDSAVEVLAKGISPLHALGATTGLVVGYVQSGKTMSFEATIALARDNGFQIVIVIAGTANNLLDQSGGRLRRDLQLDIEGRPRRWTHLENPSVENSLHALRDVLAAWADPQTPTGSRRTILITVLKHHGRLRALTELMSHVDLDGVPVLIVDDEADQASLNNEVTEGDESTTYGRLMELKACIPSHTYLQYTATPQAPLLISITDELSPAFVQVLEPGADYVGGKEFFDEGSRLVRVIPHEDIPSRANPPEEAPESLIRALRVFMVGVTAGLFLEGDTGNRSMLVHPSQLTAFHRHYFNWVLDILEEWKRILEYETSDPDYVDLMEDLHEAYDDLASTVGDGLPKFEDLRTQFRWAFRNVRVLEVNSVSGATPNPTWREVYAWVLVGGQAMDRGYTIEGLTVTYMPRGVGVGNADTIQQRARFFGYKRPYLGYCRVYLEDGTLSAFRAYVDHEDSIRSELVSLQDSGQPLAAWKRAFLLDPRLKPCRSQVLEFDYMRGNYANSWVSPRVVLAPRVVLDNNRTVVEHFLENLEFDEDTGHPDRTEMQRHLVCRGLRLAEVYEDLLSQLRSAGASDSQKQTGLLLQLRAVLDELPDEPCTVFIMSPSANRQRTVDEDGMTNLFQGEHPVNPLPLRGSIYPGDIRIKDDDVVTVQLRRLDLKQDHVVRAENVAVASVWVPTRFALNWLVQEQPYQVAE